MCEESERSEATENTVFVKQKELGFVSPEQFRGYPKASARKGKINRRKGKSMIATDTPEKIIIEERGKNIKKSISKAVENAKRKIVESSEEEDEEVMSLGSETESSIPEVNPNGFEDLVRSPETGDFVLVQFKITEKKSVLRCSSFEKPKQGKSRY